MKRVLYYIAVVLAFLSLNANAQVSDGPRMMQQLTATSFVNYSLQYDKTPFLVKGWSIADITVLSGEVYTDVRIKYDLYKGNIIYYNSHLKKQLIIDNEIIELIEFKLDNDIRTHRLINHCTVDSSNRAKCRFYFDLVSDSISLWSQMDKKINKYTDVSSGYGKLGVYYTRTKYYLVIDGAFSNLPQNKRKFLKLYPEDKKELAQFIRKNHLSFKKEDDLVRVMQELNRLLALNIN